MHLKSLQNPKSQAKPSLPEFSLLAHLLVLPTECCPLLSRLPLALIYVLRQNFSPYGILHCERHCPIHRQCIKARSSLHRSPPLLHFAVRILPNRCAYRTK